MWNEPVNCPHCGRFLKWHSSGDPDADDYKEWYTCTCNEIECIQGDGRVFIRSKQHWGRSGRYYRGSLGSAKK